MTAGSATVVQLQPQREVQHQRKHTFIGAAMPAFGGQFGQFTLPAPEAVDLVASEQQQQQQQQPNVAGFVHGDADPHRAVQEALAASQQQVQLKYDAAKAELEPVPKLCRAMHGEPELGGDRLQR